jgi:hypothetical protein
MASQQRNGQSSNARSSVNSNKISGNMINSLTGTISSADNPSQINSAHNVSKKGTANN